MRIAVFASGTGSNFAAIADAIDEGIIHASIDLLVCDKKDAAVIKKAQDRNIKHFVFNPKAYESKCAYETQILAVLKAQDIDLIVLAGYMRLIGPTLLEAYPRAILNIHPSLLPKHKGLDALGQAITNGDWDLGATVHYVDASLDGGEIIRQRSFRRYEGQKRHEIEKELHRIEHKLYVEVLQDLTKGGMNETSIIKCE